MCSSWRQGSVLDDADPYEAVNAAAFGGFMNQGQICMSTERIVIDDKSPMHLSPSLRRRRRASPIAIPQ
jgi:benzaldehyde dehydrogenase (NAD)